VAFVLLQDSADSGDVLNGKFKHDQRHGGLTDVVEFFQVVIHNHCELFQISDLIIDFLVTSWLEEIPKEEATDVIISYLSIG
jgi:hypothetical protein